MWSRRRTPFLKENCEEHKLEEKYGIDFTARKEEIGNLIMEKREADSSAKTALPGGTASS